jgi:hypothetical protein
MSNPERNSFDVRGMLLVVALAVGGTILGNSIERLEDSVERLEKQLEIERNFNYYNSGGASVVDPGCLKVAPVEEFSPNYSPDSTETTSTSTTPPNTLIQSTTTTTPKVIC